MARKKIVAGNWKMNMTPSEAVKLVEELKPLVVSDDVEVVYCVPAIDIVPVVEAVKGTNVAVGAENMYYEEKGAYTGEISPEMLVDAGVKYVIIGHSERRDYFKECDRERKYPEEACRAFCEEGFNLLDCPEEYGGAGLDLVSSVLMKLKFYEYGWPALTLPGGALELDNILAYGTKEQQ